MSRRRAITGAGAVLLGTSIAGTVSARAATPASDAEGARVGSDGAPIETTIASAPVSGYTYKFVTMYDFFPFYPNALKTWGGFGVYSAGVESQMRATVDIPPGALVRDVEYYVFNNSGAPVNAQAWQAAAGSGSISSIGADAAIASAGEIVAALVSLSSDWWGPYPLASKLMVGITTPTNGAVQINGARIGFSGGAGTVGLVSPTVRAYDSRVSGGKLLAGSTRSIALPTSVVVPGTTGVVVSITALGATVPGSLKVYRADGAPAPGPALYFRTTPIAGEITLGVSANRHVKVFTDQDVHIVVDIVGTIA